MENNEEVQLFREYLQIASVHPNPDYVPCVEFLQQQAKELDLPIEIYHPADVTKPIVIITWTGTQPQLPSILLSSHMDVVTVDEAKWTFPPFAANVDVDGKIYARGAQDCKCIGMQYLAAIRALKKQGFQPKRNVHVIFTPDEEIGGVLGMMAFVKTKEFADLNVGFALDEGAPSTTSDYILFYGERTLWQLTFKIVGPSGHGSLLLQNTAAEKFHYLLNKMMELRAQEVGRWHKTGNSLRHLGDVTSINLTKINGGTQNNVIPSLLQMTFDIRITPKANVAAFEQQLNDWCTEAGGDIELIFEQKKMHIPASPIDETNPYWMALNRTFQKSDMQILPIICPGATDAKNLRGLGIPAFGFSPIKNTKFLAHAHNEYIDTALYLEGIEIYTKIIPEIANV